MAQLGDIKGAGLGLKREWIPLLRQHYNQGSVSHLKFLEIAPENWIGLGGKYAQDLAWFLERYPVVCHGLSLSLGGPDPLNIAFLKQVKQFLYDLNIPLYSEHLSYCSDITNGYIYDLLPMPFTQAAVKHLSQRILTSQDILGQRIAVENISFYVSAPLSEMDEISFINAVLEESDCLLHLDVNNIYVNSINFGFDPYRYIDQLPSDRIVYGHIAGHLKVAEDLLVDTHGEPVITPVWELLAYAYTKHGIFPTTLERDSHFPPFDALITEINQIHGYQQAVNSSRK